VLAKPSATKLHVISPALSCLSNFRNPSASPLESSSVAPKVFNRRHKMFVLQSTQSSSFYGFLRLIVKISKILCEPGMVAHAFNPSTQEAEAGGFLSLRPAWSTK
jgi:flagellar basal body rod protein FlgC